MSRKRVLGILLNVCMSVFLLLQMLCFQAYAESSSELRLLWNDRDITDGVTLYYHGAENIIGPVSLRQMTDGSIDNAITVSCVSFSSDAEGLVSFKEDAIYIDAGFKPGVANLLLTADNGNKVNLRIEMVDDNADELTGTQFGNRGFFVDETGVLIGYKGNLTQIVIPQSINGVTVRSIGESAFEGNAMIESITIPDGITEIGLYAFYNCSKLQSITIGQSLNKIGDGAFENCTELKTISFDNECSLREISSYCFDNCQKLQRISIPQTVAAIQDYAFNDCVLLEEINIPGSLEYVGSHAFWNTSVQRAGISENAEVAEDAFETLTEDIIALRELVEEQEDTEKEKNILSLREALLQEEEDCSAIEPFETHDVETADLDDTITETLEVPDTEDNKSSVFLDAEELESGPVVLFFAQDGSPFPEGEIDKGAITGREEITGQFSEIHLQLDNENRVIREDYYDLTGNRMPADNGAATCVSRYDLDGNKIEIKYYGMNGAPVDTVSGYATVSMTYGEKGELIKEEYQAADWSPACNPQGAHIIEYEYDEQGTLLKKHLFDVSGQEF